MSNAGQLVRSLRQQAGLTQESLAQAIDCSKAHLSLMESGQRRLSPEWAERIERALGAPGGSVARLAQLDALSPDLRQQLQRSEDVVAQLRDAMQGGDPVAALKRLVGDAANVETPLPLAHRIPVINKVAAGYPAEFTDLSYPARVADEYITCPDVRDPDAFAARVVGDSMEPAYHEGDLVVFSPAHPITTGCDCYVRLEQDEETTFKRIVLEDEGRRIRLQPLNQRYPVQVLEREEIAGMYAAVYVLRPVRGG